MQPSRTPPVRIILDTNVWSQLADAGAGLDLHIRARRANVQIVVAPSVAYELLRNPNSDARNRAARLITNDRWHRLMPEAYLESQQIIGAMGRARPEWTIERPDRDEHDRTHRDWARRNTPAARRLRSPNKAGFWERVRNAPGKVASHLGQDDQVVLAAARSQARMARQEMYELNIPSGGPLNSSMSCFKSPIPGWNGEPIETWRIETLLALTYALIQGRTQAYLDWISPFVDLASIRRAPESWVRLWLYDVDAKEVPRQWLRWAFHFMQRFRKVSDGAPCDVQLSAYLPDADLIVSADKQFIDLVAECGRFSPVPIARAALVPGREAAVTSLFELIEHPGKLVGRLSATA